MYRTSSSWLYDETGVAVSFSGMKAITRNKLCNVEARLKDYKKGYRESR